MTDNEIKKAYEAKRNEVAAFLDKAEKLLSESNHEREAAVVRQQHETLMNGEFSIAVVGEFSAGKSTFLNALMGEKLLPSFTSETTATVNYLRHKDKALEGEAGRVHYHDGTSKTLPSADLKTVEQYVSTRGQEVAQKIDSLDLFLDNRFLEGNVTLVDTPGLNGVAKGHKELTMQQMERSNAGIFMFRANQLGSKTDFEFLSELLKKTKSVLLVLNYIDEIKSTEGQTVESCIQDLKKKYRDNVEGATDIPEIFPISAYQALVARSSSDLEYRGKLHYSNEEKGALENSSGMKAFEERLWKYLTQGEKGRAMLTSPLDQLEGQLLLVNQELSLAQQNLSEAISEEDLNQKEEELQRGLDELEKRRNDMTKGMRDDLREAETDTVNLIVAEGEKLQNDFYNLLDEFDNPDDIEGDSIEADLKNGLQSIAKRADMKFADAVYDVMSDQNLNLSNAINDTFNDTLNAATKFAVNTKLTLTEYAVGLEEYEKNVKELQAQLADLREKTEMAQDRADIAIENDMKRQTLEKELRQKEEQLEAYKEQTLAFAPAEKRLERQESVEVSRGGILGKIADVIVGKRHETRTVYEVDRSEREAYMRARAETEKRREEAIRLLNEEQKNLGGENSSTAQRKVQEYERQVDQAENQLKQVKAEFAEKIKAQGAKQLKRQKREIRDYIDEAVGQMTAEAEAKFRKQRDALLNIMVDEVTKSISRQIELKQSSIQQLRDDRTKSIADREEKKKNIENQLNAIADLSEKLVELKDKIDENRDEIGKVDL